MCFGYDQINDNTTFNAHVKSIIMHHHERINGTGYPNGLMGSDIHPLAKIVMLADVYDAMTSDRPHRLAHTQQEALEYIMAQAGEIFDFNIANAFSRKLVPYPVDSYVMLSNLEEGVVVRNNPNHPLRPIIRITSQSMDEAMQNSSIDLLEHNNIVIKKNIY